MLNILTNLGSITTYSGISSVTIDNTAIITALRKSVSSCVGLFSFYFTVIMSNPASKLSALMINAVVQIPQVIPTCLVYRWNFSDLDAFPVILKYCCIA